MLMSTVVAVALGVAPVKDDSLHIVSGNYSDRVGRYSETVDRNGTHHIKGFSPVTRTSYDLIVRKDGTVEGSVGAFAVSFQVREAA